MPGKKTGQASEQTTRLPHSGVCSLQSLTVGNNRSRPEAIAHGRKRQTWEVSSSRRPGEQSSKAACRNINMKQGGNKTSKRRKRHRTESFVRAINAFVLDRVDPDRLKSGPRIAFMFFWSTVLVFVPVNRRKTGTFSFKKRKLKRKPAYMRPL